MLKKKKKRQNIMGFFGFDIDEEYNLKKSSFCVKQQIC